MYQIVLEPKFSYVCNTQTKVSAYRKHTKKEKEGIKVTDLQNRILSIYEDIRKICIDNKITYFAIGGTCIGALRHKGFIPWDDDLDIAIPIEQFNKFINIANKTLPKYLEIQTGNNIEHTKNFFIKVVDKRSTFIQMHELPYPDAYKGVFVDIMPISGIPKSRLRRLLFYKRVKTLFLLNEIRRLPTTESKGIKRTIRKIISGIIKPFSFDYFYNKYMKMLKHNPFCNSELTGYVWSLRVKKLTFPTDYFSDTESYDFEHTLMSCPIKADKYLSMQFGNYMQLPPIQEQKTCHDGIVIIDKPYTDFVDNNELLNDYIDNRNEE